MRCFGESFKKRIRPGLYRYNGNNNNYKNQCRDLAEQNLLGTWVCPNEKEDISIFINTQNT